MLLHENCGETSEQHEYDVIASSKCRTFKSTAVNLILFLLKAMALVTASLSSYSIMAILRQKMKMQFINLKASMSLPATNVHSYCARDIPQTDQLVSSCVIRYFHRV